MVHDHTRRRVLLTLKDFTLLEQFSIDYRFTIHRKSAEEA